MKIDGVKIKNFKSLKDVDIELNNLTLITGINSSGKSSFIQVLLLMKENSDKYKDKGDIYTVNGEFITLGDAKSLLHYEATDDISFEFKIDDKCIKINFDSNLKVKDDIYEPNSSTRWLVKHQLYFNKMIYLSTNRVPPSLTFPFSEKDINNHNIGLNGEYTAHYLAENRHKSLDVQALKHSDSQTLQLLENTYKWLGEISCGISISVNADASTQNVKLTYQYEYGNNTTSDYSPLNVGFGLTYVLPVIVLILKSKPGDFIIIENPESHLHPAGQSKIAEMCAIAANNGVQIIVETHSDHFLNGVRVATKNGIIAPDKSQVYFFEKEKNGLNTIPRPINIDKDGKLSDWPKSFFDEWDNQLDKLLW
jgi:predicted ATPase